MARKRGTAEEEREDDGMDERLKRRWAAGMGSDPDSDSEYDSEDDDAGDERGHGGAARARATQSDEGAGSSDDDEARQGLERDSESGESSSEDEGEAGLESSDDEEPGDGLADVPLEERAHLGADGTDGTRGHMHPSRLRAAAAAADALPGDARGLRKRGGAEGRAGGGGAEERPPPKKRVKRANKNRPVEVSSARPVSRFRDVLADADVGVPKREVRDPRFDPMAGEYNEAAFAKRYKFLYDERLPEERAALAAAAKRAKSAAKRAELQRALSRVEQQLAKESARRRSERVEREARAKEKAAIAGGKRPFYLKKSVKRELELLDRYKELKKKGENKIDKFLEKKRKRNAAKDHRYLPSARRTAAE
ncbi:unnamed protein product [Pedinophyceae sp. YPF-701]|nr:unnamed protein product [Pedinophyceae sp. YPF-701]